MSSKALERRAAKYLLAAEELRDNPGQWEAYVEQGNCVVLAGPGSGKTKVLTTKLAQVISEVIMPPQGVACLTYSNECALELRKRLRRLDILPGPRVFIGTVHAFCLQHVVIPFARAAGLDLPQPLVVAAPSLQRTVFAEALAHAVSADERASNWRIRFDEYRRTHLDRDKPEWREDNQLADLVEQYERRLRSRGSVDFDDMVLLGLRLIRSHTWVRDYLRSKFPVLFIDEYQDLGVPLHRIVLNLCFRSDVRLFAVGDPDQSIYGFTGARPNLLSELASRDSVKPVRLKFNYRSGQRLVDAAEAALGEHRGYEGKNASQGEVFIHHCAGGLEEQASLIFDKLIPEVQARTSSSLGDLAVLYRGRGQGQVVAQAAIERGVSHIRLDQGSPYPRAPVTRWLERCASWCGGGWRRAEPFLGDLSGDLLSFVPTASGEDERWTLRASLSTFLHECTEEDLSLSDWLDRFKKTSAYHRLTQEPTAKDAVEAIDALVDAAGGELSAYSIADFSGQSGSPDHLNLMTLHSCKGLEFNAVFLFGMDEGIIPSYYERNRPEEARRLFFVGFTRAKREVHLLYSGWTRNQYGRVFRNGPSRFLREVERHLEESEGP